MSSVIVRPLAPDDDLESLTALLHRAYAQLGAMGLNYTAVDQTVDVTWDRIASGRCFVAQIDARIVGTVTLSRPRPHEVVEYTLWPAINQLAVEPALHAGGIGCALMDHAEAIARESHDAVVIDTAEPATALIDWYASRGYQHVGVTQWRGKRYRTVVMKKNFANDA